MYIYTFTSPVWCCPCMFKDRVDHFCNTFVESSLVTFHITQRNPSCSVAFLTYKVTASVLVYMDLTNPSILGPRPR